MEHSPETDATLTASATSTTRDADAEVEGVDAITAIVSDDSVDIGGNFSARHRQLNGCRHF